MKAFKVFVSIALLSAACLSVRAAEAPVQAEISSKSVRDDLFPKTPVHFEGGVRAIPDLEYANIIGYRSLTLDLYAPEQPAAGGKGRPLVVWVHGGGWDRGDSRASGAFANYPAVLASLAARGYVVASVNYRLSAEAKFPAALRDVKSAIRHLRVNAAKYGIDPNNVVLWGGSAGGHLASLAATTCDDPAFEPEASTGRLPKSQADKAKPPAASDCVRAAVIWYGVFDLTDYAKPSEKSADEQAGVVRGLSRFLDCDPASCAAGVQASPITHISAKTPPMLLIHGTADKTVPVRQSEQMAAALKKAGVSVETLYIPGADHGLFAGDPEATRAASLQALQRSFDYIDAATRK